MQAILLQRTNSVPEVFTFDIKGITTKTLMALSRHKSASLTSQSSRHTMIQTLRGNGDLPGTCTLTGNEVIDDLLIEHMENIRELIDNNRLDADDLCMLLPQAYNYSVVLTIDEAGLDNLLKVRGKSSTAHKDIKLLASLLKDARGDHPIYDYDGISDIEICSIATSKCKMRELITTEEKYNLVERVGVGMGHMSVLRHILLTVDKKYSTKYSVDGDHKTVINLQSLLESNSYDSLPYMDKLDKLARAYYIKKEQDASNTTTED